MAGQKVCQRFKAISFDAFGTLMVPSISLGERYSQFALEEYQLKLDPHRVEAEFLSSYKHVSKKWANFGQAKGHSSRQWWNQVIRQTFGQCLMEPSRLYCEYPVSLEASNRLFDWYGSPDAWRLRYRANDTLAAISSSYKLAVLSNFDERLPNLLRLLGLAQFMQCIVFSHELPFMKPDPRIFHYLHNQLNIQPGQLLHIGDNPEFDYRAARSVGSSALLVKPHSSTTELHLSQFEPRVNPGHVVHSLYAVVDWIEKYEREHLDNLVKKKETSSTINNKPQ